MNSSMPVQLYLKPIVASFTESHYKFVSFSRALVIFSHEGAIARIRLQECPNVLELEPHAMAPLSFCHPTQLQLSSYL